jgi:hypothetical protein
MDAWSGFPCEIRKKGTIAHRQVFDILINKWGIIIISNTCILIPDSGF